jgi:hypothetical protein
MPALLGAAVLLSGCTGGRAQVTPGDVLHVREDFTFFFHDQDDRYAFPPLAEVQNLFNRKLWKVPSDLTLERPEVNVTTTKVRWHEGRKRFEADGYRVTLSCTLTVAKNAPPGDRVLEVAFPELAALAQQEKLTPRTPGRTALLSRGDALVVKHLTIQEPKEGTFFHPHGQALLVIAGVLALAALVIGLWKLLNREPAANRSLSGPVDEPGVSAGGMGMAQLAVECECGRAVSMPADGRGPLTCPCGNRVVLPPPEEFRGRSLVLSAMTVERRVHRLLAAGELPPMGACTRCCQVRDIEAVDLWLDCEQSQVRTSGGFRFLFIPGINLFLYWNEARRVEVLGHDTIVPAPLALCPACARALPCPSGAPDLVAGAAVIVVSVLVGFYSWVAGLALGLVGLVAVLWRRHRRCVRWQRDLKALVRKVPAYGQLLDMYPYALVIPDRSAICRTEE